MALKNTKRNFFVSRKEINAVNGNIRSDTKLESHKEGFSGAPAGSKPPSSVLNPLWAVTAGLHARCGRSPNVLAL